MYVWFDALLNYYTALSYARQGEDLTERFWPCNYHVMAKDILKFHSVYWPALLMAAEIELPEHLYVHGYLLMGEKKMSKSLGNVLDPFEVIERFGADALRFYCFREVSFGQDGSISPAGFESRYETELANDYGNLASRTLAMIERFRDGIVPGGRARPGAHRRRRRPRAVGEEVCRAARPGRAQPGPGADLAARPAAQPLRRGEQALGAGQGCRTRAGDLDRVLYNLAEGVRVVTLLLHAYMPDATSTGCSTLSARTDRAWPSSARAPEVRASQRIPPLFPKLESLRATAIPFACRRV